MDGSHLSKPVVRFGVFELDPKSGEVRKNGLKIKLAEQPFQVLEALLEHPGEVVTREELQQKLWSNDTFVDFDNSLNKAINKIRDALGDSAENPRFVETMARRGYRFIAPVDLPALSGETKQSLLQLPPELTRSPEIQSRQRRLRSALILGAVLLVAGIPVVLWKSSIPAPEVPHQGRALVRLTNDTGLTVDPAVSPDGKFLVYASDRNGKENLDLYVQQITGGNPVHLTDDPADEYGPSFSPDGNQVVFRSEREEGGIYVMSALGGARRLLTKKGRNPRFSPDGKWIASWDNGIRGRDAEIMFGRSSTMHIVPSLGGASRQVRTDFYAVRFPIWTADGKHLLFGGSRDPTLMGQDTAKEDWWVTPLDEGPVVKTGALEAFRNLGLDAYAPSAWSADGTRVIFSGRLGDSNNLWQIPISAETWRVAGAPERLTFGTGLEDQPSMARNGSLLFSGLTYNTEIWSLAIDADKGRPTGTLRCLTQNAAYDAAFDISADESKLVFLSNRSGNMDVWLRDLGSGRESQLTVTPAYEQWPKITADGSKVSYSLQADRQSIHVMPSTGGIPERVCEDCAGPWDWSSDGQSFLYRVIVQPETVGLMNLSTGNRTVLLSYPGSPVFQPYFSPDYRWITFGAVMKSRYAQLFITPFRGETLVSADEWITVTDGSAQDHKSRWSPDGNLLYFVSTRDGFRCLWAQHLDPATKRPRGTPFEVYRSHRARLSLSNVNITSLEFCVTRDQILFNLGEVTGNIWMTTLK